MKNKDPMFDAILRFPDMIREAVGIFNDSEIQKDYSGIRNIIYCGMGGSGISGDLLRNLARDSLPVSFEVVKHYTLPAYVGKDTLILACSYSGNTEETLTAVEEGLSRSASVFAVTSGGKLKELCEFHGQDYVLVPGGYQPRAALGYLFTPFLLFFIKNGWLDAQFLNELDEAVEVCLSMKSEIISRFAENDFYKLAKKMKGCIPLIYGESASTVAIALRFKCQICENAKLLAFSNEFPEMNHNEIVGFENLENLLQQFIILILQDKNDHKRVSLRQRFTAGIIEPYVKEIIYLEGKGESRLARWLSLIYQADFLSFFLAGIYDTEATPIPKINILKEKMSGEG